MTQKEALTNLRQLLQELYSTHDDANRIADDSGLNIATVAASDKLINYWWNILAEAHKRNKIGALIKNVVFEWSERANEIKAAFEAYRTAEPDNEPIEQIGAPPSGRTVIKTGGGAYIGGGVNLNNGEFIGRDKITYGDEIKGDKIGGDKISVGDISGSSGVAIGRNARATVHQGGGDTNLNALFAPLFTALQNAPSEQRNVVQAKVTQLMQEAGQGEQADDEKLAELVDDIASLAPNTKPAIVTLFAPAALGRLAQGATKYVLKKLQAQ